MMTRGGLEQVTGGVAVTPEVAEAIKVKTGDKVRYVI